MGVLKVRYCHDCGQRIAPEDFDRKVAVTINNVCYCGKCKSNVVEEEVEESQEENNISITPIRSSRSRYTRKEGNNSTTLWIIATVVLLMAIIGGTMFSSGKSKDKEKESSEKEKNQPGTKTTKNLKKKASDLIGNDETETKRKKEEKRKKKETETFREYQEKSTKLLADNQFDEALAVWEEFPPEMMSGKTSEKIKAEKVKIESYRNQKCQDEFLSIKQKAVEQARKGKFDKAITLWQNFSPQWINNKTQKDVDNEINQLKTLKYYNDGKIKMNKRQYLQAIDDFDQALKTKENYLPAINSRAIARQLSDNPQGAIEDYTKVIVMGGKNKKWAGAYYGRAICFVNAQQGDNAIADFCDYVELRPDTEQLGEICNFFAHVLKKNSGHKYAARMVKVLKMYQKNK